MKSEQEQSEQFTVYSVQYEYSYNIAADEQQGSAGIAIKVIDLAGNSTTYSSDDLLIIDCIAPVVPVVNDLPDYTNVGLQVITGTAEANASIYIYNNNLLVGSTETSSGGTFSKTIALDIGNNEIKVKAKDAAGNISQLSDGQTIVYDIEEPRLSFIEVSPSLSTIGSVLIGFTVSEPLISDPVVDINGNLAVRQSMENQISGIRYYYTYEVTKADQEGAATISIKAGDMAGNLTTYSSDKFLTIDFSSPDAPSIAVLPNYTNINTYTISGEAEPNTQISIYNNNVLVATINCENDGTFSVTITLNIGKNEIKITAEDSAGNMSELSSTQTIVYDIETPKISEISVNPSLSSLGFVLIEFTVSEKLMSDPSVKVNDSVADKIIGIQNAGGASWSYQYACNIDSSEQQGSATISIKTTDLADNSTTYSSDDLLVIDCVSSIAPVVNDLPDYTNVGSQVIAGTAEANASIYVYNNNLLVGSTETLANGTFNKTIVLDIGNNEIKVKAKDAAGNISQLSDGQTIVYDVESPKLSEVGVNPSLSSLGPVMISFTVSETLESDPVVTINGNRAIKISEQEQSEQFTVYSVQYEYSYNIAADEQQGSAGIAIKVIDLAGNSTTYSSDDLLIIDCIAPVVPVINDLPDYTNVGLQVITGTAEANASIYVYNNNLLVGSTETSSGGTFNKIIVLNIGNNEIKVKAKDAAGNISQLSDGQTIVYDVESPKLSEVEVNPSLSSIGQVMISFTVSEPLGNDPVVTVNGNRGIKISEQFTVYSVQYEYSYDITTNDNQGSAEISINIRDLADNSTTYSSDDLLVIDCVSPIVPVVNDLPDYTNVGSQVITGTAEANASIYIYNNNLLVGSTETLANGTFNKTITLNLGGNEIKVKAKDAAGNISQLSNVQTV